ncbi:MAG: Rid family hydrolase [Roseococcus sp.]|nr:Rid family hydrolase [Roseococcus sp.]
MAGVRRLGAGAAAGACLALRSGAWLFLRGLGGIGPDGALHGAGDPAAQAGRAPEAARALLAGLGAGMEHVVRVEIALTDRAFLAPVEAVLALEPTLAEAPRAVVITAGLARPEMLVEIRLDAVLA